MTGFRFALYGLRGLGGPGIVFVNGERETAWQGSGQWDTGTALPFSYR